MKIALIGYGKMGHEIEKIANRMIWSSMQGGGVILEMVKDYRAINAERKRVLRNSTESEVQG